MNLMKSHSDDLAQLPPGFPSWGAYRFYEQVQAATKNHFETGSKGFWHLTGTMKHYGYDWQILNDAGELESCLAVVSNHVRGKTNEGD